MRIDELARSSSAARSVDSSRTRTLSTRCERICCWISWMLPAASILPRSMMPIDVQKSASSERMWLEIKIVLPICLSSLSSAFISSRALGSRPGGRLVEDQHGRVVDQRLGQAEPLLHPLGEPVDVVVSLVGQVEQVEHLADDLLAIRPGDLVGDGEEVEELPDLHAVVDAEVVGHEADHAADRHRLGGDRVARDAPLAGGGPQAASPGTGSSCSCPRRWAR